MKLGGKYQLFLTILLAVLFISWNPHTGVQYVSFGLEIKTLKGGKYITTKGDVYYKRSGGLLVTRFTNPFETIVFTNANGEVKIYEPKTNTVTQMHNWEMSSDKSFLNYFLLGDVESMGLRKHGYILLDTKIEDGFVVTTWNAPPAIAGQISKAELVHENYLPIYIGFYNPKGDLVQKVYYSKFEKIGNASVPLNVTEFQYIEKGDSVVTQKKYYNPKIDFNVDQTYLNYKIPVNAKVVK